MVTYPHRMPAPDRTVSRVPSWLKAVLAVAAIAVIAVSIWRPWATPAATVAAGSDDVAAAVEIAPLDLPDSPRVLIFGDSWTYGSAAASPRLGYAYIVSEAAGWVTIVDGVRGSGYLKPGIDGPDFGTRMAELDPTLAPDLIIVQGSINDRRLPASGYKDAVTAAWDTLAATYSNARIVILGPAPQVLPVERATSRIDSDLAELASDRGWFYISPLGEGWITEANYLDVIDTSKTGADHPSSAGHRYLAQRLAEAVAELSE